MSEPDGSMLNFVEGALLALKGVVIPDDIGIVGKGVKETSKNIGKNRFSQIFETDKVILNIVLKGDITIVLHRNLLEGDLLWQR